MKIEEKVNLKKRTSLSELQDKVLGKVGTPQRDEFEQEVTREILKAKIAEGLKLARKKKGYTQEELSFRISGKADKAIISKWEKSKNLTFDTFFKTVEALGGKIKLDIILDKDKIHVI